ncbi:MAG TPA: TIGR03086 family metal-binding protein [Streptosporangiaceae bacterium]|nr:TIGR03086 family metal-binding protein [Streptosporangiaceae bacterium]
MNTDNTIGATSTPIDRFRHVAAAVIALVEDTPPGGLLVDSPCAGWTAHDVLNHMVGSADLFAGPARGEEMPFPNWSAMPDWLGGDPARSYRAAADRAIAAYNAPGILDGTVKMPWGEMPATFAVTLLTADHVTHAWDLEQATGVPMKIDEALIEEALTAMTASVTPELREAGFYAPECTAPPGASTAQKLAAFTGRRV